MKGKGWVDACNLVPGDIVYTKDWNTATVKSINLLELAEPVEFAGPYTHHAASLGMTGFLGKLQFVPQ